MFTALNEFAARIHGQHGEGTVILGLFVMLLIVGVFLDWNDAEQKRKKEKETQE